MTFLAPYLADSIAKKPEPVPMSSRKIFHRETAVPPQQKGGIQRQNMEVNRPYWDVRLEVIVTIVIVSWFISPIYRTYNQPTYIGVK